MTDSKLDTINQLVEEVFKHLMVKATMLVEQDADETVHVRVETEESGLLIGFHGETLNSLQLLLGAMTFHKLGTWTRIVIHVGDYREKREESIKMMAQRIALEVAQTKQAVPMPHLSAFERRIVHVTLADHPDVISESEGEGRDRRVVIKPK